MAEQYKPLAAEDEVIALRGEGDDAEQLRYTRVDEEGVHMGYMYSPKEDIKSREMPLESMLVHGYWTAPEGSTFVIDSDADEEEIGRIGLGVMTALVKEEEIIALHYEIIGTDESYYRVDGNWDFFPEDGADLEDSEEYIIEPEMAESFVAEYDKKNSELFGRIAEYEASASFLEKAFPKTREV
jgi:hypothetical protein